MMTSRRLFQVLVSLLLALLLFWLAFREVNLQDLRVQLGSIRFGWLLPFTLALFFSHYLRAVRWNLLLDDSPAKGRRSTLFAGVMVGYLLNFLFPRLGELSRPLYVTSRTGANTGNLFGTIILERILDLVCLVLLLLFITLYVIKDPEVVGQIFGTGDWGQMLYFILPALLILFIVSVWGVYRLLLRLHREGRIHNPLLRKVIYLGLKFWEGLSSIRKVKNWPLFLISSAGIWVGYALMTYIPFWMLDLQVQYDLGIPEAVVITVISAVGMALPVPGGLGAFHLFVQQSMWALYSVPLATGLTFATVLHATNIVLVFLVCAAALWYDKYYTLLRKPAR
ncbi:MAG: lysylphosphatidylglycerol synthase transmembrane domain-containing protein [Balneolaceae bacterium]